MIHFLLVLHTIIFFMQKKKSSVSQNIFARDERLLFIKSYAVPLLFMNVTSYTYQIQALYIHIRSDISTLDNGWVPSASTLLNLSARIWGSRSEASSIYSFNCFSPTSSSLDSDINVILLFIAFFYYIGKGVPSSGNLVNVFPEFLCIFFMYVFSLSYHTKRQPLLTASSFVYPQNAVPCLLTPSFC